MAIIDFIFGRKLPEPASLARTVAPHPSSDQIAVARFLELIGTTEDEAIGELHLEAFDSLTAAQRDLLFDQLLETACSPGNQGAAVTGTADGTPLHRARRRNWRLSERSLGKGETRISQAHHHSAADLLAFSGHGLGIGPLPIPAAYGDQQGGASAQCVFCFVSRTVSEARYD